MNGHIILKVSSEIKDERIECHKKVVKEQSGFFKPPHEKDK